MKVLVAASAAVVLEVLVAAAVAGAVVVKVLVAAPAAVVLEVLVAAAAAVVVGSLNAVDRTPSKVRQDTKSLFQDCSEAGSTSNTHSPNITTVV